MAAHIRVDKDQALDGRLLDMADRLAETWQVVEYGNQDLTEFENRHVLRHALLGVTVTLWIYADTHIRSDNSLPVTLSGLAPAIGIPVTALELLKGIWLEEREDGFVVLPGYCEKNNIRGRDLRRQDRLENQEPDREKARVRQQNKRARDKGVTTRMSRRDSHAVTAPTGTGTGTGTHPIPVPKPDGAGSAAGAGPPPVAAESDRPETETPLVTPEERAAFREHVRQLAHTPLGRPPRSSVTPEERAAALADLEARRQRASSSISSPEPDPPEAA